MPLHPPFFFLPARNPLEIMDLTTLRYFVEIAREENMTRAANRLHISQSALSKRLAALEERLETKLFRRRSFSIELTDEGRRLQERAEELLRLHDKIESEFRDLREPLGGTLAFGMAEARAVELVARAVRRLKESAPQLLCRIESGDTAIVTMLLEKGILDFGLVVEAPDTEKFNAVELPVEDRWVLILPKKHPLSQKTALTFEDLKGLPLFCSMQGWRGDIERWSRGRSEELTLESHVTLPNNGAVFVREGLGFLLTFEGLVDTGESSPLACRPLEPALTVRSYLIWRKNASVTPIAERFLGVLRELVAQEKGAAGEKDGARNVPERE